MYSVEHRSRVPLIMRRKAGRPRMIDDSTRQEIAYAVRELRWKYRWAGQYFGVSHWTIWKTCKDERLITSSFRPGHQHQHQLLERYRAALGRLIESWFPD
jgi:hypothetical protein